MQLFFFNAKNESFDIKKEAEVARADPVTRTWTGNPAYFDVNRERQMLFVGKFCGRQVNDMMLKIKMDLWKSIIIVIYVELYWRKKKEVHGATGWRQLQTLRFFYGAKLAS